MNMFTDRKSRLPRIWSNQELRKFAPQFSGDVANVSGWKDSDKEGGFYEQYFENKATYTITNFLTEARGFQGYQNEIFLDLAKPLRDEFLNRFDVVFNHTVLEHIFEVHKAFENLCLMSRDIVIVVVPFLQPMHGDYGDFWRFTPSCVQHLFEANRYKVLYCSFNDHFDASVYVFCLASKRPEKWAGIIEPNLSSEGRVNVYTRPILKDNFPHMVGTNSIINLLGYLGALNARLRRAVKRMIHFR